MNYLIAVDFSPVTADVMRWTGKHARKTDRIFVLHAAEPNPVFVGYEAGPEVVRKQVADEYKREHKEVQKLAEKLRKKGLKAKSLLVQGGAVKTILGQAKKHKADLIVMGSHGHGAVFQLLVGSIATGVLQKSPLPVLLIPDSRK